jgi:hypothetical protein
MIKMFFTVDERTQINERAKRQEIPQIYIKAMVDIFQDVLNRKPVYIEKKYYEPITAEDYD